MINRLEADQQVFHFAQNVDVDKLETLICLESLLAICYQALEGMAHNQTARKEYQQLEQQAQYHQDELKRDFLISQKIENSIESKVYKYLVLFKPPYLPLRAVINLAINLASFKMDIYKHFLHTAQEQHGFLSGFLEDNVEEMSFLQKEKEFHQNRLNVYLKF